MWQIQMSIISRTWKILDIYRWPTLVYLFNAIRNMFTIVTYPIKLLHHIKFLGSNIPMMMYLLARHPYHSYTIIMVLFVPYLSTSTVNIFLHFQETWKSGLLLHIFLYSLFHPQFSPSAYYPNFQHSKQGNPKNNGGIHGTCIWLTVVCR